MQQTSEIHHEIKVSAEELRALLIASGVELPADGVCYLHEAHNSDGTRCVQLVVIQEQL